tara:strand:+ start:80899 stop:81276 length:378 start_codon:yes stop_codon:yes gene_type:complete
MGKIFLFLILVIGGGLYYLQQNFQVGKGGVESKMKTEEKTLTRDEKQKQDKRLNKFLTGECITKHKDGWEFTKIYNASEQEYTYLDCHQYKGCMNKKGTMDRVDFELSVGKVRVFPCPRVQGRDL